MKEMCTPTGIASGDPEDRLRRRDAEKIFCAFGRATPMRVTPAKAGVHPA